MCCHYHSILIPTQLQESLQSEQSTTDEATVPEISNPLRKESQQADNEEKKQNSEVITEDAIEANGARLDCPDIPNENKAPKANETEESVLLGREYQDMIPIFLSIIPTLAVLSSSFMGLFLLEMASSDETGSVGSIWVLILTVLLPVFVWIGEIIVMKLKT